MKMRMNNIEIRCAIERKRICYADIAKICGINPATLSRWMRDELQGERKERVEKAIKSFDL